jgi:hypothetical protein
MITKRIGLLKLSNLYETFDKSVNVENMYGPKHVIMDYLTHNNNELKLYLQNDIIAEYNKLNTDIKYTK